MDPIADMLTRIRNAQKVHKDVVIVPFSKVKFKIANILKEAGFVANVEKRSRKTAKSEVDDIEVKLKYTDGIGAVSGLKMISRPSRRMYIRATDIRPIRSGYGIAVISTSRGIMNSIEARKSNLGGEVMFEVW